MENNLTHDALVELGRKWLTTHAYSVVVTELSADTGSGEIPDCLGFKSSRSTLIECKVSRQDFLRDKQKIFRQDMRLGMGRFRYYLAPKGLIKKEELPEKWGLIEVNNDKARLVQEAYSFSEYNLRAENAVLLSAMKRLGVEATEGISVKIYTLTTSNKTTITFAENEQQLEVEEVA